MTVNADGGDDDDDDDHHILKIEYDLFPLGIVYKSWYYGREYDMHQTHGNIILYMVNPVIYKIDEHFICNAPIDPYRTGEYLLIGVALISVKAVVVLFLITFIFLMHFCYKTIKSDY